MSKKSELRDLMEQHMKNNKGPFTVVQLAKAIGEDEGFVRRRIQHLIVGMVAVNVSPGVRPTLYQHAIHYAKEKRKSTPNLVNRRDPVVNSMMPNGSRSYWRQHMARFNEPPRGV